jgi:hypothetical protein
MKTDTAPNKRKRTTHVNFGTSRSVHALYANFENLTRMAFLPAEHVDFDGEQFMGWLMNGKTEGSFVLCFSRNKETFHEDRFPIYQDFCDAIFRLTQRIREKHPVLGNQITLDYENMNIAFFNAKSLFYLVKEMAEETGLAYKACAPEKVSDLSQSFIDPTTGRIRQSIWRRAHDFLTVTALPSEVFWGALDARIDMQHPLFHMDEIWHAMHLEEQQGQNKLVMLVH